RWRQRGWLAVCILRAGAGKWMVELFATAVHDGELRPLQRKDVAVFCGYALVFSSGEKVLISLPAGDAALVFCFGGFAVTDKSTTRESCQQLQDAADVVAVIVGD